MKSHEELSEIMQKFLEEMIDHVDSVAVVYTQYDGEHTAVDGQAKGNAYAIDGSLAAWLKKRTSTGTDTTPDQEAL